MSPRCVACATPPGDPDQTWAPSVVFKRRIRKPTYRAIAEFFYPRGGWRRSTAYVMHRLRRLPDTPHRICVGIAAGTFVSFLPLWGLHFLLAALVAWMFRGNILAALLGTFFGNPITFPIIAVSALELGNWLIGGVHSMKFSEVMAASGYATSELTANALALFTGAGISWERGTVFLWRVFLPFMLGGTILGIPTAVAMYYICLPLVQAYQRSRIKRLKARLEAARKMLQEREGGDPS